MCLQLFEAVWYQVLKLVKLVWDSDFRIKLFRFSDYNFNLIYFWFLDSRAIYEYKFLFWITVLILDSYDWCCTPRECILGMNIRKSLRIKILRFFLDPDDSRVYKTLTHYVSFGPKSIGRPDCGKIKIRTRRDTNLHFAFRWKYPYMRIRICNKKKKRR